MIKEHTSTDSISNTLQAVIDLGSLKVKLSVFTKDTAELQYQESSLVLLGKELNKNNIILDKPLEELSKTLLKMKGLLDTMECKDITIIATEALRQARNKEAVEERISKVFPGIKMQILTQELEGAMFFTAIAGCFPEIDITTMDIGGGSVQVFHGKQQKNKLNITYKHLFKTGTYVLQQKYSPVQDAINEEFPVAVKEIKEAFSPISFTSDILVFGSTCMQSFITSTKIQTYTDKPFHKHPYYVTVPELEKLLHEIRGFPPAQREHFYADEQYFTYGADYLLANVLEVAERTKAAHIYPSNMNSSYGFIRG